MTPSTERDFSQQDLMAWVRNRFKQIKGAKITANEISAVGGDSGFRSQPIQVNIRGDDIDELIRVSNELKNALAKVPGFVDLDTTYRGGKPEVDVNIARERAANLGVPSATVGSTIRALVAGDAVSSLKDGLDVYDVTVQLPKHLRDDIGQLDNLQVRSTDGQLVDLASVVKVLTARDRAP